MQIGRALAVFCVDEVVIYNDGAVPAEETGGISEPNTFLAHVLQFLETPQYILIHGSANLDTSEPIYSRCTQIFDTQRF